VTPCADFALTSEVPNGLAYSAPVPPDTSEVLNHKTGTEALYSASHLRNKTATKAPQRASLSKSSGVKSTFQREVKGSSLGADSGDYAASAPKGTTRVLSREARTKALCSANCLSGNAKNEASSRASLPRPSSKKVISKSPEHINTRSARVSALDRLSSVNTELREFLTNKRKLERLRTSPSYCEQVGCQLVTVHLVHC